MKTKIDKSSVMKRAWAIYRTSRVRTLYGRNTPSTFSHALRCAWIIIKKEAAFATQCRLEQTSKSVTGDSYSTPLWNVALVNHYANALRGTYFGD